MSEVMSAVHFEKTTVLPDPLHTFVKGNQEKDAAVLQALAEKSYREALVGCADARVVEAALDPSGNSYIVTNAGNIVYPKDLPDTIERIVVVSHEKCGACATADKVRTGEMRIDTLTAELQEVVSACVADTSLNAELQAEKVRQMYEEMGKNVEVIAMSFNHETGEVKVVEKERLAESSQKMQSYVRNILTANDSYVSTYNPVTPQGDMREGQNPRMIVMNLTRTSANDLSSEAFSDPNTLFEVKPAGAQLTPIAIGSAQYAFSHALQENSTSFADSFVGLYLVQREEDLTPLAQRLQSDSILQSFHTRAKVWEGGVFAAVINPKSNKIGDVYKLR